MHRAGRVGGRRPDREQRRDRRPGQVWPRAGSGSPQTPALRSGVAPRPDLRDQVSDLIAPIVIIAPTVIPGRAQREPGIHRAAAFAVKWIPGSRFARPGMTEGGAAFAAPP